MKTRSEIKKETRGMLYPNNNEIDLYRLRFVEGANLEGRSGKLYQVLDNNQVNTDSYIDYITPVTVSYYLIQNPKKSILLKYGWYTENKDNLPIICYLTFLDNENNKINPSEGALLEISARSNPHGDELETQKFRIMDVKTDLDLAMFICNLVPHRAELKPIQPLPNTNDPINENRWFNRKLIGEEGEALL